MQKATYYGLHVKRHPETNTVQEDQGTGCLGRQEANDWDREEGSAWAAEKTRKPDWHDHGVEGDADHDEYHRGKCLLGYANDVAIGEQVCQYLLCWGARGHHSGHRRHCRPYPIEQLCLGTWT